MPAPAGLPVTQVYGWLLCPETGRILIQERDEGTCSLPAGMPEPFDDGLAATLAREAFEENQVRIGPGPGLPRLPGGPRARPPRYAQIRMAGIFPVESRHGSAPGQRRADGHPIRQARLQGIGIRASVALLRYRPWASAYTQHATEESGMSTR
jgi:8-oxo-dGTP pyrophosphatase MutT (NUDIX family)